MKNKWFFSRILSILLVLGLFIAGCAEEKGTGGDNGNDPGTNPGSSSTAVTFTGVSANGSATQSTTKLTLTFSQAITGLSADDITISGVSGVTKGTLSGSGSIYTLEILNFSANGTLSVSVSKSGYTINGSPKTVQIYYYSNQAALIDKWYFDQYIADSDYMDQIAIEFLSNGKVLVWGNYYGYTYTATNDVITIGDGFNFGTASYSLDGSILTISNIIFDIPGAFPLSETKYYKKRESIELLDISANGSATQSTTQLTLTFDKIVGDLSADDISLSGVSGVTKGTLSGSGSIYTLEILNFSANGTLNVSVSSSKYIITGSPQVVYIWYTPNFNLISVTANGNSTQTTTQLTLTFDKAIPGLTVNDITLSGVSGAGKYTLSGTGPVYSLGVSIPANGTLSVSVSKSGYEIIGSPQTVTVYWYRVESTTYTVTYNANGGSGTVPTSQAVTVGSSVTLNNGSGLSRSGYTFGGWNINAAGTGTNYNGGSSFTPTGNITLYAKWNSVSGTIPSTPTGVNASSASSSSITVSWSVSSNATGYRIYRSSSATGTYTEIGTSTTTSYTNSGLTANTTYYYKVAAYNTLGNSSQSNYASATTQSSSSGGGTVPSAPTGLSIDVNTTGDIVLTWNAVTGATSYKVYWSNTSSGGMPFDNNFTGTTAVDNIAPTPGRTNYYWVTAVNNAGESVQSSSASISSPSDQSSALVGKWYGNKNLTGLVVYEFASSGKYYSLGVEEGTYTANNTGTLTLTRTLGGTVIYSYRIIGNALVLSGTGGGLQSGRTYK